jgi:hypothetical protein
VRTLVNCRIIFSHENRGTSTDCTVMLPNRAALTSSEMPSIAVTSNPFEMVIERKKKNEWAKPARASPGAPNA